MSMLHLYDDSETADQDYQAWEDVVSAYDELNELEYCADCWDIPIGSDQPIPCPLHREA